MSVLYETKNPLCLGIWFGFPSQASSLINEGIGRYAYNLAKHLIQNFSIDCKIWCYRLNYEIILELFQGLVERYLDKIKIFTEINSCRLLRSDRTLRSWLRSVLFTFVALGLAGVRGGLFGLAAFSAERRTKEIGIRKVLGASVFGIMARLNGDFLRWVLLANLAAWPAAYFAMQNWLRSFPYWAGFHPFLFLAAGAVAALLAILTVSLKTAKASRAKPVHALRYE